MDSLLETVRAAFAEGADEDARTAGASACRTLLATLAPTEAAPPSPPPSALPADLAAMFSLIKGVPVDQLLDLAIARLRAVLPPGAAVTPSGPPLKFHLLPTPPTRRMKP